VRSLIWRMRTLDRHPPAIRTAAPVPMLISLPSTITTTLATASLSWAATPSHRVPLRTAGCGSVGGSRVGGVVSLVLRRSECAYVANTLTQTVIHSATLRRHSVMRQLGE
jgi:hypothetical protein